METGKGLGLWGFEFRVEFAGMLCVRLDLSLHGRCSTETYLHNP